MGSEQAQKIRAMIQATLEARKNGTPTPVVYRDEPIPVLRTAAQMAQHTPPRFRQMRKLAQTYGSGVYAFSSASLFWEQGRFMAEFVDDFPEHEPFFQYFPTYQAMTDRQLRCYFSWRTQVRRGVITQTALSYAYVYLYELINQIGVASPQEGFDRLYAFWQEYRTLDAQIDQRVTRWLHDYAVWYGLDPAVLHEDAQAAVMTLMRHDESSPADFCAAVSSLSSYRLENSRFYKLHPDDVDAVVYRVWTALDQYFAAHRKNSLTERLFGRMYRTPYAMFQSALFEPQPHPDTDYVVNELLSYHCRGDQWTQERFYVGQAQSKDAGALLKEIDYQMRQAYGMKSTLKPGDTSKLFRSTVEKELAAWLAEREAQQRAAAQAAVRMSIDLSRLQDIRRAALETQQRLIVDDADAPLDEDDEQFDEAPAPAPATEPATEPAAESPSAESTDTLGLSAEEYRLLQCLLYDRPYADWVRAAGQLVSVLVDAVNDTLFDRFADTVIGYDGDDPAVIEDYIEDLKGLVGE